jgi:hypothetical protein
MNADLVARAFDAFRKDVESTPSMTLRAGNAVDEYRSPMPFDAVWDAIDDKYLERSSWGLSYLDPASWRHYLPHLMKHALEHLGQAGKAVDALLSSLRPPDREPPRLRSLTEDQEKIIVGFLEVLAFDSRSATQAFACQVMEEWWIPHALYREDRAQ